MKVICIAVTHHSVHSVEMLQRFVLDWRLQTSPNWECHIYQDGPIEGREDRITAADIDWSAIDSRVKFYETPTRTGYYGAYNRALALQTLERDSDDIVLMCCADDSFSPRFVEIMDREFTPEIFGVFYDCSHHHYDYNRMPLGVYPAINRADWISGCWRLDIAKKVGVSHPEEYAADGFYHQECFASIGNDEGRLKILPNILVFKN